ncbi:MAG: hypothetical protein NT029_01280 [Armatimonadetes bacterium]|nr:hypothetical protein [Armatimonadota bacterium]
MRRTRGGAAPKVLLLLVFVGLFVGFFIWKQNYGVVGRVDTLEVNTAGRIAFMSQDASGSVNLFMVKADGSDMKQLTNSKPGKRAPAWSPDGSTISYVEESASDGAPAYQVFMLGNGRPLQASYGSVSKDQPCWRPDGRMVGYLAGGAVKIMAPNGSGIRQVYPPPHKGGSDEQQQQTPGQPTSPEDPSLKKPPVISYSWSPNGVALAAVQVTEGENAYAVGKASWWQPGAATADGGEAGMAVSEPEGVIVLPHPDAETPVLLAQASRVGFSWFSDSKRLAVALTTSRHTSGIFVFRTDEKNLPAAPVLVSRGLTVAPENPAVSPDGKLIAAELWRLDSEDDRTLLGLVVLPAEPSQPLAIETKAQIGKLKVLAADAHMPRWSPDGTRILFWRTGPKGRDLWVCGADGSGAVNVTKGAGDSFDAQWSPAR